MTRPAARPRLPPDLLLRAYAQGWFPMAHDDGELYWHDPDPRAVFPLERLRTGKRTLRHLRQAEFQLTRDRTFEAVMRACADRPETWIDEELIHAYTALHHQGHAHSVETWLGDELVGGLYGVAIGGAFFGESMFSRRSNASKAAFHHLVAHLCERGFRLFDTQYLNPFTAQLGAVEISRDVYKRRLAAALSLPSAF